MKRGETVLVKPNMAWDRTPEQGASTNPEVVAEVVRQCRAAGPGRVIVAENPVHDAARVAERSGIAAAVAAAGGELVAARRLGLRVDDARRLGARRPGTCCRSCSRPTALINVPVVKHHSLSLLTCGIKNHMGLIGGSRGRLHQEIHTRIVDLASAFRPTLTVVDATRVMLRNGPTGGRLEDVATGSTRWPPAPIPSPATRGRRASSGSTRARWLTSSRPRAAASAAWPPARAACWRWSRMAERELPAALARTVPARSSAASTRATSCSSSSRSLALMTDEGIRRFPDAPPAPARPAVGARPSSARRGCCRRAWRRRS